MALTVSCVLVDVGDEVVSGGHYEAVRSVSLQLLCQRFATDPTHQAAVIVLGSFNTRNALADAARSGANAIGTDGAYSNIEVIRPFEPLGWSFLRKWHELIPPGGRTSDMLDACIVATDMYESRFSQQARNGRVNGIFFVITGSHRMQYDEDAHSLKRHMDALNIRVFQVVSGNTAVQASPSTLQCQFFDRVLDLSDFSCMLSRWIPVNRKRQVTKCRINFELSCGVSVPVSMYILAKAESIPTFKRRLRIKGREESNIDYISLSMRRFLYRGTDPLCTPVPVPRRTVTVPGEASTTVVSLDKWNTASDTGISYAFPYGKQLVSVSPFERDLHFGVKSDAGLVLIGTLPISAVQRWWCLGSSELVVGLEKDAVSTMAMASLFWAATRLQCALLCRYSPRRSAVPRPVLLIPRAVASQDISIQGKKVGSSLMDVYHTFCLVHIPFSDDVSIATFSLPPSPKMTEVHAMGSLVESLNLEKTHSPLTKVKPDTPASLKGACDTSGRTSSLSKVVVPTADGAQVHCADSIVCRQLHPLCIPSTSYSVPQSPPFSSASYASFLPTSSLAFEDAIDFIGIGAVPNPVLQRFYALLTRKIFNSLESANGQQIDKTYSSKHERLLMALDEMFAKISSDQAGYSHKVDNNATWEEGEKGGYHNSIQKLFPLVAAGPLREAGLQDAVTAVSEEFMYTDQVLRLADVRVAAHTGVNSDRSGDVSVNNTERSGEESAFNLISESTESRVKEEDVPNICVGMINPVRDFEEMLLGKDANAKDTAIFQMQQVVLHLANRAHSSTLEDDGLTRVDSCTSSANCPAGSMVFEGEGKRFLLKAFMCLEALRSGCSRESKGCAFNSFLHQLRDLAVLDPGGGVGQLWSTVAKEQLPLISSDEDPRSEVSKVDACSIYTTTTHVSL